jgi:hypothetical protein
VLMQDALRQAQGRSATDTLVKSYDISPAQAQAVVRTAAPAFAWGLETASLNRGGLADLVEAVGQIDKAQTDRAKYLAQANIFHDEDARAHGDRILDLLVGPPDARATLAAYIARRAGVSEDTAAAMLPGFAVLTLATLAGRARGTLGALLAVMPSLGRWSKGSPHADLADILRRRCGGGPYASRQLFRVVRRRLGRAGGFGSFGAIGWYARYMLLRPAGAALRPLLDRMLH